MITTKEAAKRFGITQKRVQLLLRKGRIKGIKIGRQWFIEEKDCIYERQRGGYRPRKVREGDLRPCNQKGEAKDSA